MSTLRVHTHASEDDARSAIEVIDAARSPTEQAVTYLGRRSTEQAIEGGLAVVRKGTIAVTTAGLAEGYAVEAGQLVRHHTIPARTWAHPIALADGTYAVPVCAEVAGVEVETRTGKRHTVPDDSTARTITAADRKVEQLEEAAPIEIGGGKGRT